MAGCGGLAGEIGAVVAAAGLLTQEGGLGDEAEDGGEVTTFIIAAAGVG